MNPHPQEAQASEAAQYKAGNEFLPFHPDASHVSPDYRDGWNACYQAASQVAHPSAGVEARMPLSEEEAQAAAMPDCWVVVKDGSILGTHDEPCQLGGIEAVRYVPAAAAPNVVQRAVAEVSIEPDYWSRGHFYEGRRHVLRALSDLDSLPLGTKLYAFAPCEAVQVTLSEEEVDGIANWHGLDIVDVGPFTTELQQACAKAWGNKLDASVGGKGAA